MATILQTASSNVYYCVKSFEFQVKFSFIEKCSLGVMGNKPGLAQIMA